MRFSLFSIKDKTAGVFLAPFVARSETDAKRTLAAAFEDPQFMLTPAGRYPQDFVLYFVGVFDDESGEIADSEVTAILTLSDLRP